MTTELTVSSDLVEVRRVQELIEEQLQAAAYSDHDIFAIKLAVEEALVNAIKHGNQMDPDKRVHLLCNITPARFDILITDEGAGFDLGYGTDSYPSAEVLERPGGRGLLIMRAFMTEVEHRGRGNVVLLTKVRDATS